MIFKTYWKVGAFPLKEYKCSVFYNIFNDLILERHPQPTIIKCYIYNTATVSVLDGFICSEKTRPWIIDVWANRCRSCVDRLHRLALG